MSKPISFGAQMSTPQVDVDMVQTLQAKNPMAVAVRDISQTLTSNYGRQVDSSDTGLGPNVVFSTMQVRRLTPRECERLQGFPDDFTLVPYRGKPAADGPRYKALGNSMAVPCMAWLGRRIQMVEELLNAKDD